MLLDKVYELRSKIEFTNQEALQKITELVDMIIHSSESETQTVYPKIKIGR